MSKTLVTYFSRTGNTRKVAEAIFEALDGPKEILPMGKASDLAPYGLIFVGFPVHSHSVPFAAEMFLKTLPAGKKVGLFCTHGSTTGSPLSREALVHAVSVTKSKVLGTFSCRGKVSMEALTSFARLPEHEAWADMAATAATHPDAADLEEARAFARLVELESAS